MASGSESETEALPPASGEEEPGRMPVAKRRERHLQDISVVKSYLATGKYPEHFSLKSKRALRRAAKNNFKVGFYVMIHLVLSHGVQISIAIISYYV